MLAVQRIRKWNAAISAGDWTTALRRARARLGRVKRRLLGIVPVDARPQQIHLSWPRNPASSLCVTWQVQQAANAWDLEYRPSDSRTWHRVRSSIFPSPGRGFLQRAHIDGQRPDTTIEYRFFGRERPEKVFKGFSARTAPAGPGNPFTFIFFSDTGLIGRRDGNATGTEAIFAKIRERDPLFVLGGGDYAYANRDGRFASVGDAVDEWFRQAEVVVSRCPLYAQYGNHEILLQERFEDWSARFAHPAGFDDGRSYSFDVAAVHFAGLFMPDVRAAEQRHADWLDDDLRRARASGARRLIVFHHEPIYGHGRSHPAAPKIRDMLVPIYDRHRVDLVLSAHDQNYERTFPLVHRVVRRADAEGQEPMVMDSAASHYPDWKGVIYAKVSPAGKMSEIGNDFSRFTVPQGEHIAVRDDTAHHFAEVHVTPDSALVVTVLSYDARRRHIGEVDRFQLGGDAVKVHADGAMATVA
jgi:acid phosphatase type 7